MKVLTPVIPLFLRWIVFPFVRFVWVKDVEGLNFIPQDGPVIIAANHESYFDFICFAAVSPRPVHYLAAEVFFESKFWRPFMVATRQIKVDRNSKDKSDTYTQVHDLFKQGGMLGIFPEGTRTRTGVMGRAYTGAVKFALKERVPVVPVGIVGSFNILPPHKKIPRFKKCSIKVSRPIVYEEYFKEYNNEEVLRRLTDELMFLIAGLVKKRYEATSVPE